MKFITRIAWALGLSCQLGNVMALPPCPETGQFNDCFGTRTYGVAPARRVFGKNGFELSKERVVMTYVGEFKDDLRNGYGTFNDPDGSLYAGQWLKDTPNGDGTRTSADGLFAYVGKFINGKRDGHGRLAAKNGDVYVGEFKDGAVTFQTMQFLSVGIIGEWSDGGINGQGVLTYKDGRVDLGEWKGGRPHGLFIQYAADKSLLRSGLYKNGRLIEIGEVSPKIFARIAQADGATLNAVGSEVLLSKDDTNLDDPRAKQLEPSIAIPTVVKDCPDCPDMVVIPAGSFVMGSDKDSDEMPPHKVMISSFLIGKAEITQAQWLDVMGTKPSRFSECGQNCPVESVSWDDIQQFITNLNQKTGRKYRLPSEAEWEYAARGGTTTQWSHGNDESKLGAYAWHGVNSREKTQVVGQKLPNGFGLFDMHGNVWEWTEDCYHGNYAEAPNDGSVWTTACMNNQRVLRGGSWDDFFPAYLRSAYRHRAFPDNRFSSFGFRLARDL